MMLELSLLCLLDLSAAPAAGAAEALARGERLAAEGDLEAALAAYATAYADPRHEAAAAYNAGTLALQLGRLPAAVLWLRRAQAAAAEPDPWTADNLAAARRLLGTPDGPVAAPGPWSLALRAVPWLTWGAVALGWGALGLALATGRSRGARGALAVLGTAGLLFGAGAALSHWGPREAVLLEACPDLPLPVGSEVWALPFGDPVRVLGPGAAGPCPAGTLGLVRNP